MKGVRFRRKEKEVSEKIPKQKKLYSKKAIKWIWGLVLFLCFSGGFAWIQSMKTSVQVSFIKEDLRQLQKKEKTNQEELILTPEIESFMNRFVALYMNTFDDSKQEKKRQELLIEECYAQDWPQETVSLSSVRKLTAASFIGLKKVASIPTASYKVTYDIRSVDPETKKETTESSVQVLNIPFSVSEKGCRVIAYPYFTAESKNTEKQAMITYDETLYESADPALSQEVQAFVKDFLEKYAKNSAKDMAYMMKEPEGLNQTMVFDQVEMNVLLYKEKKSPIVVKATVDFRDGHTSLIQKEQMTITVVKRNGQYFVEKLTHNWADEKG